MTSRMRDFDAFFAEQQQTPIKVKLFGEEWECPPEMPAATALRIRRALATYGEFLRRVEERGLKADDPMPDDFEYPEGWHDFVNYDEVDHAREVCGAANVDAWLERGITMSQLRQVAGWVVAQHEGRDDDGGDEGNARRRQPQDRLPATSRHAAGRKRSTTAKRKTRSSPAGGSSKRTSAAATASDSDSTSKGSRTASS